MGITSALVLFAVIWFMTFLIVIPFKIETQGDLGDVVEGTQAGAPENHYLSKKAWIATGISAVIWAIVAGIIVSGAITVDDLDFFDRYGPPSTLETDG